MCVKYKFCVRQNDIAFMYPTALNFLMHHQPNPLLQGSQAAESQSHQHYFNDINNHFTTRPTYTLQYQSYPTHRPPFWSPTPSSHWLSSYKPLQSFPVSTPVPEIIIHSQSNSILSSPPQHQHTIGFRGNSKKIPYKLSTWNIALSCTIILLN